MAKLDPSSSDLFALFGRTAGDARWSAKQLRHYTETPEDERYRELADRIVGEMREEMRGDPFARALAVSAWLGREGIHSLKSGHAGAADPTADFLFGNLTGSGTGIRGVVARTAPELLVVAGSLRPELIVLDLFLGGADGFAAVRTLTSQEATRSSALIATSLSLTPDVVRAARGAGADEVLQRPVGSRVLGKLLERLRRRGR